MRPKTKIVWALIVLFVPLANVWLLERWKAADAQRLIEQQKASVTAQHQAYENLAYEELLPLIRRASGAGPNDLLGLLVHLAPSTFDRVRAFEIARAGSKAQVHQIERFQNESRDRSVAFGFEGGLSTARQYARLPIAGQAARAFHDLVPRIPTSQLSEVDTNSLQLAVISLL